MIITDLRETSEITWSKAYSLQTRKQSHGDATGLGASTEVRRRAELKPKLPGSWPVFFPVGWSGCLSPK